VLFGSCAADDTAAGIRDAALLGALYGAGLRAAEAARLDLADYDHRAERLLVHPGPGCTGRIAYLAPGGRAALDAWCVKRGGVPGALLWPTDPAGTPHPGRLTAAAVQHIVRRRALKAGLGRVTPLDLLCTFAGDLLDAGASPDLVRRLMAQDPGSAWPASPLGEHELRLAIERLHVPYRPRIIMS
jgi:site-specific recombinase XerD